MATGRIQWSSRFEIDPKYEAELVDLMNRNFLAGNSQSCREIQPRSIWAL
jgi:hypothetical protein